MDFFNKLGKKVSETYDATAEKTSKLAKEAKLRMKINENKSDIKDLYREIGKKVYEKHIREENIDIKSELVEECSKIDAYAKDIEDMRMEILALKDLRLCKTCTAEIAITAKFCPKCGAVQEEIVSTPELVAKSQSEATVEQTAETPVDSQEVIEAQPIDIQTVQQETVNNEESNSSQE